MNWRIIEEFTDYSISDNGQIKRIKYKKGYNSGRLLKPARIKCGYLRVDLYNGGKRPKHKLIHRLVLENFKPIENMNNLDVNHKDGNKENNSLYNLEWLTRSENHKHAYSNKLKTQKGDFNNNSKLKSEEVWLIKRILNSKHYKNKKISLTYISKMFKTTHQTISAIKNNKLWKHIIYEV